MFINCDKINPFQKVDVKIAYKQKAIILSYKQVQFILISW